HASAHPLIPTRPHASACRATHEQLLPALVQSRETLEKRAEELSDVAKTGRTHLMEAMPVTLGQELGAWAAQIGNAEARIEDALKRLRHLPQGGTAVGSGVNAHQEFGQRFVETLSAATGFEFVSVKNKFIGIAAQDSA